MENAYAVSICRISYGHRDIIVKAASEEEAEVKALDIAGNFTYNEHSSEYEISGITELIVQ